MPCSPLIRIAAPALLSVTVTCLTAKAQPAYYGLYYTVYHDQSGSEPNASPMGAYVTSILELADAADLDSASLGRPGFPGVIDLTKQTTTFYHTFFASDQAEMVAEYPAGEYTFQGEGGTLGPLTLTITRPDPAFWPSAIPAFSPATYDAAQFINPDFDFTLEFNGWESDPVATERYGFLYLYDNNLANPIFYSTSFGNWESQHTIPAGTLPPNSNIAIQIFFDSRVSLPGRSGVAVVSFSYSTTMQAYVGGSDAPCIGDLNGDGVVDDFDFVDFVFSYNLLDCADSSMPSGCPADFNIDGVVDDADFVLFVPAYNELICP